MGTTVLFESGAVPRQWSFMKEWTAPVARKMKGRDLVACFNVILFYIEISVVRGVILFFSEIRSFLKKMDRWPSEKHKKTSRNGLDLMLEK